MSSVHVVVDYADTVTELSLIPCGVAIDYLRGHYNDYADIHSIYLEGLLLTLKEQSGEIKYLGVFTYPVATL